MNSVERGEGQLADVTNVLTVRAVVEYSRGDLIPQEPPHEVAAKKPKDTWPENGAINFNNITMSYRPGLPKVLKGISMNIKGGEKIGVVGRYADSITEVNGSWRFLRFCWQDWCGQEFAYAGAIPDC